MFADNTRNCLTAEGPLSGNHFVEHRAKTVDVRTSVERFTHALFRGHVERCSQHDSTVARRVGVGKQLRQTKIDHAHTLKFVIVVGSYHQYVLGLEIAMDHTLPVRRADSGTDPAHHAHGTLDRKLSFAAQKFAQRRSSHKLHHDKRRRELVIRLAEIMNRDHVWMM